MTRSVSGPAIRVCSLADEVAYESTALNGREWGRVPGEEGVCEIEDELRGQDDQLERIGTTRAGTRRHGSNGEGICGREVCTGACALVGDGTAEVSCGPCFSPIGTTSGTSSIR